MIAILSPARNVGPCAREDVSPGRPLFMAEAMQLVEQLRQYSPWQLESLLDVPPERALALYDAYRDFSPLAGGAPALLAYVGAAYRNMGPTAFDAEELAFAQGHLRILSALYGMLRPLDGILNHRLGLKKDFRPGGMDLHGFWGDKLYRQLFARGDVVVNLASVEYARLVKPHMRAGDRMVACRFLLDGPEGPRVTVATVRAARGLMARFLIENRVDEPEGLREFDSDGYRYSKALSAGAEYVFLKRARAFPY